MQDDPKTVAAGDGVSVHSGFPNPAADAGQGYGLSLDFNKLLVRHPSSTYMFRVAGHNWASLGLYDGDVAVIDRALQAGPGDLLVVWQGGSSRLCRQSQLTPEDKPWGVVTAVIHRYRKP
ncbi:MAG TPA: S24 family peptidase [Candidatus Saccharimonadales bacterium]|nr:S24 family peptidase [Candidatus Saccharimonadales bacterium]